MWKNRNGLDWTKFAHTKKENDQNDWGLYYRGCSQYRNNAGTGVAAVLLLHAKSTTLLWEIIF